LANDRSRRAARSRAHRRYRVYSDATARCRWSSWPAAPRNVSSAHRRGDRDVGGLSAPQADTAMEGRLSWAITSRQPSALRSSARRLARSPKVAKAGRRRTARHGGAGVTTSVKLAPQRLSAGTRRSKFVG
jgi:hypothetical protein